MRVRAIKPGFHGKLREIDEEFDVEQGRKASWYVPVGKELKQAEAEAKAQAEAEAKAQAEAEAKAQAEAEAKAQAEAEAKAKPKASGSKAKEENSDDLV